MTFQVLLQTPVSGDDHIRGAEDAPVTLVEYGDFECQFCGRAYPVVRELERRFARELRIVFRSSPRSHEHPHAQLAAEAAEAAGAQGHFWEMHDRLLEHQSELGDEQLIAHAAALHLDVEAFRGALSSHAYLAKVNEQERGGARVVRGTPTFFINGVHFDGTPDVETLSAAVTKAAAAARAPG